MTPIRIFGLHVGSEVFFITNTGKPTLGRPETLAPGYVRWLSDEQAAVFKLQDAHGVLYWSSAGRVNQHVLNRLLATRTEWSKK